MFCDYFHQGLCRSCTHLNVAYPEQLHRRQDAVANLLASVPSAAHMTWLAAAASSPEDFRTKAKMAVGGAAGAPTLGLLDAEWKGVDLSACPILDPQLRAAMPALSAFVAELKLEPYDVAARRGELKYLLVTVAADGGLMVRFVLRSRRYEALLRSRLVRLRELLPTLVVASVNLHPTHAALVEGAEEVLLTEAATLPMRVGDVTLHVGPQSFTQTNTQVAAQLYRQAARWAAGERGVAGGEAAEGGALGGAAAEGGLLGGEAAQGASSVTVGSPQPASLPSAAPLSTSSAPLTPACLPSPGGARASLPASLWDLYCGVGGFALHAAAAGVRQVVGVEVSPVAIASAQRSARDLWADEAEARARFIAGDAVAWAVEQDAASAPDVVVVNPPRRGIGPDLAGWLNECAAPRVIYSSCNPVTLAKDLAAMPALRVVEGRLFDMFPHTDHAEATVLCERV